MQILGSLGGGGGHQDPVYEKKKKQRVLQEIIFDLVFKIMLTEISRHNVVKT